MVLLFDVLGHLRSAPLSLKNAIKMAARSTKRANNDEPTQFVA